MKYKKIILFFLIALPISIALRFLQLFNTIESSTGFFKQQDGGFGIAILILIFAVAAITAIFAFFSHRSPEQPPKVNLPLGAASAFFAVFIAVDLLFSSSTADCGLWQKILYLIFGIATILFFTAYAVKDTLNISIPKLVYAVPVGYFIFKIICNFAGISALALISDNILLMGADCLALLFLLNFAKLYNGIDGERGFRKLLSSGLTAIIICFTQSVPNIIYHFISADGYLHTPLATSINVFFTGVFISVFVFFHFKYSNACK